MTIDEVSSSAWFFFLFILIFRKRFSQNVFITSCEYHGPLWLMGIGHIIFSHHHLVFAQKVTYSGRLRHVQQTIRGGFRVFALLLIVTPPNLQNHLTLASEGYLNNQCFGSSSRNVAVGGEVREKYNPEMSVCNGDSTSGRCRRTQTWSTVLRVIRISHEQICCCSVEGTFQLIVLAKNLLSRPPLKKMGPVFDPAKTTGENGLVQPRFHVASGGRWSLVAAARTCRVSLSLRFDVKKRSFPRLSGGERPLTIPDRSLIDGILQDDAR